MTKAVLYPPWQRKTKIQQPQKTEEKDTKSTTNTTTVYENDTTNTTCL